MPNFQTLMRPTLELHADGRDQARAALLPCGDGKTKSSAPTRPSHALSRGAAGEDRRDHERGTLHTMAG